MFIVYFSNVTNNTERFVFKVQEKNNYRIPIKKTEPIETITEPYVLITPTYGDHEKKGMIPHQVKKFLKNPKHIELIRGVISSGNRNFGNEYGIAGEIISRKFNIPHLYKFELAGEREDVIAVKNMLSLLDNKQEKTGEQ
jgi:protein involved in ribonucleotide reduction